MLNGLFSEFDRLAIELGVEKIKAVGDNYMLAGGLPKPRGAVEIKGKDPMETFLLLGRR